MKNLLLTLCCGLVPEAGAAVLALHTLPETTFPSTTPAAMHTTNAAPITGYSHFDLGFDISGMAWGMMNLC